jgi:hypothetical protein
MNQACIASDNDGDVIEMVKLTSSHVDECIGLMEMGRMIWADKIDGKLMPLTID